MNGAPTGGEIILISTLLSILVGIITVIVMLLKFGQAQRKEGKDEGVRQGENGVRHQHDDERLKRFDEALTEVGKHAPCVKLESKLAEAEEKHAKTMGRVFDALNRQGQMLTGIQTDVGWLKRGGKSAPEEAVGGGS